MMVTTAMVQNRRLAVATYHLIVTGGGNQEELPTMFILPPQFVTMPHVATSMLGQRMWEPAGEGRNVEDGEEKNVISDQFALPSQSSKVIHSLCS
jgi:hypothetical protein